MKQSQMSKILNPSLFALLLISLLGFNTVDITHDSTVIFSEVSSQLETSCCNEATCHCDMKTDTPCKEMPEPANCSCDHSSHSLPVKSTYTIPYFGIDNLVTILFVENSFQKFKQSAFRNQVTTSFHSINNPIIHQDIQSVYCVYRI
jgi:hypothetical protein